MAKKNLLEEMQQSISKVLERPVAGPEKARTSRAILEEFKPPPTQAKPESRPVIETSQVTESSLAIETRQVKTASPDRSETSQVIKTSQATETKQGIDLMAALPDVKGHTRFYHQLVDHLYPQLDAYEQATHFHLYRLSWGHNKAICTISLQRLSERAGLSYKSAQRAVNNLERRGLVRRQGWVIGYGKEQGIEFWVAPVPCQVTETSQVKQTRQVTETDNKRKALKENISKGEAQRLSDEDLESFTATVRDHLMDGKAIEEIEAQFAAGLHPDDWWKIGDVALRQPKEGEVKE